MLHAAVLPSELLKNEEQKKLLHAFQRDFQATVICGNMRHFHTISIKANFELNIGYSPQFPSSLARSIS